MIEHMPKHVGGMNGVEYTSLHFKHSKDRSTKSPDHFSDQASRYSETRLHHGHPSCLDSFG